VPRRVGNEGSRQRARLTCSVPCRPAS
jgi:hypothetical protein